MCKINWFPFKKKKEIISSPLLPPKDDKDNFNEVIEEKIEDIYNKNIMIILDNGHGENTPGKSSPKWKDGTQLFEYEFNRDIVSRISKSLIELNIQHTILVPELNDISLTERCNRANKICEQNCDCLLISVHANAGGGTGWECHIYNEKTKSMNFANILVNHAKQEFIPEWKIRQPLPNQSYWVSNFQILRSTKCPAVLTENFFMDNEKDCRFIMSEDGRNRVAKIHVESIKKMLELK